MRPFKDNKRKQPRHGDDLVRFVADRQLSQDQALIGRPGADQMQRRARRGPIEGAPEGLAVDRDNPLTGLGKALHEAEEPSVEAIRIEQPEHPREGVVARNAVLQRQKLFQKPPFRPPKQRHVGAGLTAAQHRTQRNDQQLVQRMPLRIPRPRVLQSLEYLDNPVHGASLQAVGTIS